MPFERQLDLVMSKRGLLLAIVKAAKRKATGPDGPSFDLMQLAPDATVDLLHPLFVKVALGSREPLMWKGGWQVALHKGGLIAPMANWRAILLGCHVAKIHQFFYAHAYYLLFNTSSTSFSKGAYRDGALTSLPYSCVHLST